MDSHTKSAIVGAAEEAAKGFISFTRQAIGHRGDDPIDLTLTIKTSEDGSTVLTLFAGEKPVRHTTIKQ